MVLLSGGMNEYNNFDTVIIGIINPKGELLATFPYSATYSINDTTALIVNENQEIIIDIHGNQINGKGEKLTDNMDLYYNPYDLKNGWEYSDESNKRVYTYKKGNRYQLFWPTEIINNKTEYIINPFKNGPVAVFLNDEQPGVVDVDGNIVVPFGKYHIIYPFSDGMAMVRISEDSDLFLFVDVKGNELKPKSNITVLEDPFSEGLVHVVQLKGKMYDGFMNKQGKIFFIKKYYEWYGMFSEGLCKVMLNDKYGFIDTTGKEIILPTLEYDEVDQFKEGLCRVKKGDLYGFIDRSGKEVIPVTLPEATSFKNGYSELAFNPCDYCDISLINTKGEKQEFYFQPSYGWENGYRKCFGDYDTTFSYASRYQGLILNQKVVVPMIYSGIDVFPNGIARVSNLVNIGDNSFYKSDYINLETGVKYFSE